MEWRRGAAPMGAPTTPPPSRGSSSRSSLDSNWRSSQPDSFSSFAPPTIPHWPEIGQVWYLKNMRDCEAASPIANGTAWAHEGIHGHPVCVINTNKAERTVDILMMTSLGGHDLAHHTGATGDPYYAKHADEYLPINGAAVPDPDPEKRPQLSLPLGENPPPAKNIKSTYLRFTEVWTCREEDLDLWYHELRAFSPSSLATILEWVSPYITPSTSTSSRAQCATLWSGSRVQLPSPPPSPTRDASSTSPLPPRKCRSETAWKSAPTPRKGAAGSSNWRASSS